MRVYYRNFKHLSSFPVIHKKHFMETSPFTVKVDGTKYTISAAGGGTPTSDSTVVVPGNPYSTTPYTDPDIFVEYW